MNLSKEITGKIYDELMTQEVTRLVNLKREEIAKAARKEVDKFFKKQDLHNKIIRIAKETASGLDKRLETEIKKYFDNYDYTQAIEEYMESDEGYKAIDGIIREILAKGIKFK